MSFKRIVLLNFAKPFDFLVVSKVLPRFKKTQKRIEMGEKFGNTYHLKNGKGQRFSFFVYETKLQIVNRKLALEAKK